MLELISPWTFAALAASLIAFYASARGLQIGPGVEVIALTSVAANLVAIVGGVLVFRDSIGTGAMAIAGPMISFGLVIAGAALIPAPTSRTEAEDRPYDGAIEAGKKQASAGLFDRWARFYERDLFSRYLRGPQQRALAALDLGPEDRLLDIGCGTGAAVRDAAPHVREAVGVDLSERMVSRARELATGLANVEFMQGDSEALPFPDSSFSALICTTSFHHYPNPQAAAGEMARVLRPGGRLAIGEANADRFPVRVFDWAASTFEEGHVSCYRPSELAAILERAGLRVMRTETMSLGQYAVLLARADS